MSIKDTLKKGVKAMDKAIDKTWPGTNDDGDALLLKGISNITEDMPSEQKLSMFQQRFWISRGSWDWEIFDKREEEFDGMPWVDKNINDNRSTTEEKYSDCVYNVAVELIEAQVDNTLPQPTVTSKRKGFEDQARMIEDAIKNDLLDTNINQWNDRNERTTYKHGFSALEVCWNQNNNRKTTLGDIELIPRHPKQIIPQIGVWDMDKMDYVFIVASVTKMYVEQRYGIDLTVQTEQFPEVNTVGVDGYSNTQYEKVSEITCWYIDEDGDLGKFVWCLNAVLEDYPKYFYRRLDKCDKCGEYQGENEECPKCGGKLFAKQIQEYEIIDQTITLQRKEPVFDEAGIPVFDPETGDQIEKAVVIPKGTKVRYYVPSSFPLLVRVNVPTDFGFGGVSDLDLIRPQYNAIKKILSNLSEKVIHSQHVIAKLRDHKMTLASLIYQVVDCDDIAQLQALRVLDLSADITQDLAALKYIYESAQNVLGITNSFQGKADSTAQSGVAKQLQINQSGGRMASKQFNKFDHYKQLFEMMFYFKLSFYDEVRHYSAKDHNGNTKYFDFSKYEFLYFDEDSYDVDGKKGEWRYNDDFTFTVDNGGGFLKDKSYVFEQTIALKAQGAFDPTDANVLLWTILDSINFPNAGMMKKALSEKMQNNTQQQLDANGQPIAPQQGMEQPNGQPAPSMGMPAQSAQAPNQMPVAPEVTQATAQSEQQAPMQPEQQTAQPEQSQLSPEIQAIITKLPELLQGLTPDEVKHLEENPELLLQLIGGNANATQAGQV